MKVRVISAIVAIIIAIPFIYYGGLLFALAVGIIAIQGFREVLELKKFHKNIPFVPCIIALFGMLLLVYNSFDANSMLYGISHKRLILLLISLLIPSLFYKKDKYTIKDAFILLGLIIFLGIGFNSIIVVRSMSLPLFLYLITIPVCTDTFAMLIGVLIGKHKMCLSISPKKSWEGSIAGLILGTIIPCIFYNFLVAPVTFKIVLSTMILSVMGQIGDLIFSKIKRENDIKDFSNIMPGHGGALDRLDSAIIIFMTYILLLTIF